MDLLHVSNDALCGAFKALGFRGNISSTIEQVTYKAVEYTSVNEGWVVCVSDFGHIRFPSD